MEHERGMPPSDAPMVDKDLLKKADDLVDLAVEVRNRMRRITELYEEREYGTKPELPDEP